MSKNFDAKLIGGMFLIIGTSIGGGMLALPIASGPAGFINSTLFLVFSWFIMTVGALLILEVNLWLPRDSNIISMAKHTLGLPGQIIAWIIYLSLLYMLLSAYIAGGSDILFGIFERIGIIIPQNIGTAILTLLVALLIYRGIAVVDYVNRGLIIGKFGVYLLLALLIAPFISLPNLQAGETRYIFFAITVSVTSFGFATIVPSLRTYFEDDVAKLRKAIIIGSLFPLLFYLSWNLFIMGILPREGSDGLLTLFNSAASNTDLAINIQHTLNNDFIPSLFQVFASACLLTSFLGVALCLFDFLADGLNCRKYGSQGLTVLLTTFVPPLIIALFFPGIFIKALGFAGITCVLLLLLLPAVMAWSGRYVRHWPTHNSYQLLGGKLTLILIIAISIGLTTFAIWELFFHG